LTDSGSRPAWTLVTTLWGIVGVAGDRDRLWYVGFPLPSEDEAVRQLAEEVGELGSFDPAHVGWVEAPLRDYFLGKPIRWDGFPVRLVGRPLQIRVWEETRAIPHGETRTYAEIAIAAGFPRAHRAAGSALAANPAGLLVPCHRVVATSGLGGYGRWLHRKRALLRLEGFPVERLASAESGRIRRRARREAPEGDGGERRGDGRDGEDREG